MAAASEAVRSASSPEVNAPARSTLSATSRVTTSARARGPATGYTAQLLAKEAPSIPVFAFTANRRLYNRLALWFGVFPLLGRRHIANTDLLLDYMESDLHSRGLVEPGDNVVFVRAARPGESRQTNLITVRVIGQASPSPL